jgi:hypothetical protein
MTRSSKLTMQKNQNHNPQNKNICYNCAYWKRIRESNYGNCKHKKLMYSNILFLDISNIFQNDLLLFRDTNEEGSLICGRNFGCVHFSTNQIRIEDPQCEFNYQKEIF